jgi:hypothetical protein
VRTLDFPIVADTFLTHKNAKCTERLRLRAVARLITNSNLSAAVLIRKLEHYGRVSDTPAKAPQPEPSNTRTPSFGALAVGWDFETVKPHAAEHHWPASKPPVYPPDAIIAEVTPD